VKATFRISTNAAAEDMSLKTVPFMPNVGFLSSHAHVAIHAYMREEQTRMAQESHVSIGKVPGPHYQGVCPDFTEDKKRITKEEYEFYLSYSSGRRGANRPLSSSEGWAIRDYETHALTPELPATLEETIEIEPAFLSISPEVFEAKYVKLWARYKPYMNGKRFQLQSESCKALLRKIDPEFVAKLEADLAEHVALVDEL
jgi:hypothetical protein